MTRLQHRTIDILPRRRELHEVVISSRRKILLDQALTTFIEAIPDFVLVLNEGRQILAANSILLDAFSCAEIESLVGKRPGEALGCLFFDEGADGCGTGPHCAACGAADAIAESQSRNLQAVRECHLSRTGKGGNSLDVLVVSTPMVIADVKLTLCVLKDISAQKRREVLEKLFFHDIINTAGAIRGIASLLERAPVGATDPSKESMYKQWLADVSQRLVEEIVHQRRLVEAERGDLVLDLAPLNPEQVLSEVSDLYAKHEAGAGVKLVTAQTPSCVFIVDAAILRRILGNLVKNALEATDPGGTVTLSAADKGTEIVFSVHNPGVIPETVQLQIFHRSFSTKAAYGRGIGTYSVKLFTEKYLKGKVSFESREGTGTIFNVTLPKKPDLHS